MSVKLLIIDDEEGLIQSLKSYLERKGFIVTTSLRGDVGLELLKQENPELLLLDLHLKEGPQGITVLKEALTVKPSLKIAIFTGFGDDKDAEKACLDLGAKLFIKKPIQLSALKDKLDTLAKT